MRDKTLVEESLGNPAQIWFTMAVDIDLFRVNSPTSELTTREGLVALCMQS